jgi:hypothetical protein
MLGSLPTDVLDAIIHLATASPLDSPPGSASDRPASQIVRKRQKASLTSTGLGH